MVPSSPEVDSPVGGNAAPHTMQYEAGSTSWPLGHVMTMGAPQVVQNLDAGWSGSSSCPLVQWSPCESVMGSPEATECRSSSFHFHAPSGAPWPHLRQVTGRVAAA